MSRVYLHSLGCRLNQSEVEATARQLAARGCVLVSDPAQADVLVVNTCAVTAQAERKSRHLLRALHRANPTARIAAVGCGVSFDLPGFAALPGVVWAVPNADKERLPELIAPGSASRREVQPLRRTRALVKVQDGCDNRCTYCVVWRLRGPSRSRPLEAVIAEVEARLREGYQEVVLTGVNLGAYGRQMGMERGLAHLVAALLQRTALPRLRLSSLEPWDVDESLFELWADPRLCRQLHLPLQSGCDAVLRRMGRPLTAERYARLAEAARAAIPDLALTADVLVGFPGEDEAAFAESMALVEAVELARLHVFPFSPRPGTPAALMSDQVPEAERVERARRMRELGSRLAASFRQRFVGREMAVLWERRREDGLWHGLTDNYLSVVTASDEDLHNRIVPTRLLSADEGFMRGETNRG
jgi:threonylcarbamoyladenosine tRNA methylthiotransferase MtaB